ncbi:MAG TPA: aminotransferase class V-fold PLP-dependent enzyme [Actinospica sp.]|nr:aminotransferase class V-fold PLP-dependent enzyme [Actinospica sp.]
MSDFHAAYPEYAATSLLDELRAREYGYLDSGGHVYLDYAGAGLPALAQIDAHALRLRADCYGSPHSGSPASMASAMLVERARSAVLRFFNTTPEEYAVIFTPNATGACRLVGESYPFRHRGRLVLTADNHNSVNGIREFARSGGVRVTYVPLSGAGLRTADTDVFAALSRGHGARPGLFAYPAQSNFSGVQYPLHWVTRAQAAGYDVLLDAAAYVPASRLDLSAVLPEFVAVSWYKVFGYPTGVGCLLARRDALPRLRRPWFSGSAGSAGSAAGVAAFEDGTVNFLSIPDVTTGLDWISGIGVGLIHQRVFSLTGWLLETFGRLRHSNGVPLALIYGPGAAGPRAGDARGGTIAFNFLNPAGRLVDERAVARDAAAAGISLRTGCFCNPGAGERALGAHAGAAPRTSALDDYLARIGLPTGGAVRVSLGIASTLGDVETFLDFAERTYRDRFPDLDGLSPRAQC